MDFERVEDTPFWPANMLIMIFFSKYVSVYDSKHMKWKAPEMLQDYIFSCVLFHTLKAHVVRLVLSSPGHKRSLHSPVHLGHALHLASCQLPS